MDVFAIFENDPHRVLTKLGEVGIHSVYTSGVKASGPTWQEEEGCYIGLCSMVVVGVDRKMLEDRCDGYAVHSAMTQKLPIYAIIQDGDPTVEKEFSRRYEGCRIFRDAGKLISAVVEFQIENRTDSGLSIKADMYFRAMLYDEAITVCHEYLERARRRSRGLVGIEAVYIAMASCEITEILARIHFARGELAAVEEALLFQIAAVEQVEVIWGRDRLLYAEHLLLTFTAEYAPDAEKERSLRAAVEGKQCFGFGEKEKAQNTEKMHQRVRLFFEKCKRLRQRYLEDKADEGAKMGGDLHRRIAEHVQESVLLFGELAKENAPLGFPECLATAYERLAEYCRVIGEGDLAARCLDAIAPAMRTERVEEGAAGEEGILNLRCIKAYLGETQPGSGSFDAFISHRSADTELAKAVYSHLKKKGREVFFDRVSLPVLGDSEYRNSILEAIDNSAHFILVASDLGFFDSKWVKEECNLFCDEKREGRKNGNFVMVFPRSVCEEIFAANKKTIPIQLRSFEIIALEDMEESLLKYVI